MLKIIKIVNKKMVFARDIFYKFLTALISICLSIQPLRIMGTFFVNKNPKLKARLKIVYYRWSRRYANTLIESMVLKFFIKIFVKNIFLKNKIEKMFPKFYRKIIELQLKMESDTALNTYSQKIYHQLKQALTDKTRRSS